MEDCTTIVKDEDVAYQEGEEEVIEEVIEDEQVWMGEDGYYHQEGHEMMDHQVIEYDEYQAFLPVRGGDAYWTMNLPDLMSKIRSFAQQDGTMCRLITCFNRRCHRQVAFKGYLYTVKDWVSETGWTTWNCINEQCYGQLRTHPPEFTNIQLEHDHLETCLPDEHQIAVRIGVYDARLLAEFTDTSLAPLYEGVQERIKTDFPDVPKELFPSFESIQASLLDHRHNKIYRKRFEMQKFKEKQKKMNMTADEVLFAENASGMIKARRTKPFPMSLCSECNDNLVSTNLPSQDQLIHHMMYTHGRRLTIERYEFKDLSLFEHYVRELNANSRFKMKRMGLADENMYYLCTHDDRLAKNGVGRASRLQQQHSHCTAFIRIFDWRIITKQENARITIDYCLEHQPHPYAHDRYHHHHPRGSRAPPTNSIFHQKEYIDYYTPEVFIRDLDDKKLRSQKIIDGVVDATSVILERPLKRPIEVKTYLPPPRSVRPSFGARALAPPLAAQIAAGISEPYVDMYSSRGENQGGTRRPQTPQKFQLRQSIRNFVKEQNEEGGPGPSSSRVMMQEQEDPNLPPPRIFLSQKPWTRQTERQNFKDVYTFNAVCKVEDACMQLLNRLQTCQQARIGLGYREKIAAMVRRANTDPGLVDGVTQEDLETSWVLQKPVRGRPRKRALTEDEEEDEDGGVRRNGDDDDDVEMEAEPEPEDVNGRSADEEEEEGTSQKKRKMDSEVMPLRPETPQKPSSPTSSSTSPSHEMMMTTGALTPRAIRSETVESTESTTSSTLYPTPSEGTTRSGRSRKPPARLQE